MDSSHNTSIGQRLSRLVGLVGLAAAAVVVSVYVAQRQRNTQNEETHTEDLPTSTSRAVQGEDDTQPENTSEEQSSGAARSAGPTTSESDDRMQTQGSEGDGSVQERKAKSSEVSAEEDETVQHVHAETTVQSLEDLTFEELYRLAQRHDVAGRSNMRKAQLLEALQALGIKEAES